MHVRGDEKRDFTEFFNLCLSLARGIDFAVANNEVPARAQDLPLLLKQNACKLGWFSVKDTGELLTLANEIGSCFCSGASSVEQSCDPAITKIMSRYYPRMKMGQILASLEVKPGFGAFVVDFHISKNTTSSPHDKIRLFVAQTDTIETSSCIVSPPQVNFLLNGRGVDRRTNVYMDIGPQIPTNVTAMLKFGTNLLQAVGQFNGHYIIVIAFMGVAPSFDTPTLQDYVQPVAAAHDTDMEVIEGASRISLNCPISFRRIKTPVKGCLCKHRQCFDFGNFVGINSRRPSWRCPHCNQSVCYTDLRIDQYMVKVLREVGENVADVIISADGSWKAVLESNDPKDQPHGNSKCQKEGSEGTRTSLSNAPSNILDLTEGDDEVDSAGTHEVEERKPYIIDVQDHSVATNLTMLPELNYTREISRNTISQVEDDYWAGIFLPDNGSAISSGNTPVVGGISETSTASTTPSPVLTDAISPALNRESSNGYLANPLLQNQLPLADNLQLQQLHFGNSLVNNQYGRSPAIPRNVTRTPIAIQALPAQPLAPAPHQQSRSPLSLGQSSPFVASRASPSMPPSGDSLNTSGPTMERQQQQFPGQLVNQIHMLDPNSPASPHPAAAQNWSHRDPSFIHGQSVQQIVGRSIPSQSQLPGRQNPHPQQPLNRLHRALSQPPAALRTPPHLPRTQIPQESSGIGYSTGTTINTQRSQLIDSAQRAAQRLQMAAQMGARQAPSVPLHPQMPRTRPQFHTDADGLRASYVGEHRGTTTGMGQPTSRVDNVVDLTSEDNWRPAGRMRGSLTGRAYSALSQHIIQPTQLAQAAARPTRPAPIPTPQLPPDISAQLQAFLANSGTAHSEPSSQGML